MMNKDDRLDPGAALDMVRRSHAAAAARGKAPVWYYPVTGALLGVQMVSIVTSMPALSFIALLGIVAAFLRYQKVTGVRPNGLSAGSPRARMLMASMVLVIVSALALVVWLHQRPGSELAIGGVGVAVAIFVTIWGPAWERVFRRDEGSRV